METFWTLCSTTVVDICWPGVYEFHALGQVRTRKYFDKLGISYGIADGATQCHNLSRATFDFQ